MNDVERFIARDLGRKRGVALHFVEQIAAVMIARLGSAGGGRSLLPRLLDEIRLIARPDRGAACSKRLFKFLGGLIRIADRGVDRAEGHTLELIEAELSAR